jgi:nitrite reductase/ring-hydroxylating ferredoxin subunit
MSWISDFFKALAGICKTSPLDSQHWKLENSRITVELDKVPELKKSGGAVYLSGNGLSRPILIMKDNNGNFLCVENKCTHMGRKLDPDLTGSVLRCCSVSHSTFGLDGQKLSGPAKGPIKIFPHREHEERLYIEVV